MDKDYTIGEPTIGRISKKSRPHRDACPRCGKGTRVHTVTLTSRITTSVNAWDVEADIPMWRCAACAMTGIVGTWDEAMAKIQPMLVAGVYHMLIEDRRDAIAAQN